MLKGKKAHSSMAPAICGFFNGTQKKPPRPPPKILYTEYIYSANFILGIKKNASEEPSVQLVLF